MKISGLTKAFAKAACCIALAATAGVGAVAGLPSTAGAPPACVLLASSALSAGAPANGAPADVDIEFNFITPLFTSEMYESWLRSNELSLLSTPDMIKVTANTSQGAIDQVVSGVKESVTKNGGSLNRIVFSGDDGSNMMINPLPNAQCSERLDHIPDESTRFSYTKLTDILQALLVLKNQEFPGHKAGEPLAKAIDVSGCNMFASNNSAGTRPLPAREISRLAGQLNMPIIASVTSIGYEAQYPITGVFWAFLPNGNVSRLPGPYFSFDGEDIAQHESWVSANGFTIQNVEEPVKDHPFSVVNTPDIASTVVGGAGSTFVTLQTPQTGQQRVASSAPLGNPHP